MRRKMRFTLLYTADDLCVPTVCSTEILTLKEFLCYNNYS